MGRVKPQRCGLAAATRKGGGGGVVVVGERGGGGGGQGMGSKAFAPTWYRALTWYSVPWSPPRTHFEPWKAVGTWGRGSLAAW